MINLIPLKFDLAVSETQLNSFKQFLDNQSEIGETELLKFFKNAPQLILLMGLSFGIKSAKYQTEQSLFNDFRTDFTVSNKKGNDYLFIEFEDAKKESIFKQKKNKTSTRYEWASRFEHGFSQVIDWYSVLDDLKQTNKMKQHFGNGSIKYIGILVIGRDQFIQQGGNEERLKWRREKTTIDSKPLSCMTYDQLYESMAESLELLKAFSQYDQ